MFFVSGGELFNVLKCQYFNSLNHRYEIILHNSACVPSGTKAHVLLLLTKIWCYRCYSFHFVIISAAALFPGEIPRRQLSPWQNSSRRPGDRAESEVYHRHWWRMTVRGWRAPCGLWTTSRGLWRSASAGWSHWVTQYLTMTPQLSCRRWSRRPAVARRSPWRPSCRCSRGEEWDWFRRLDATTQRTAPRSTLSTGTVESCHSTPSHSQGPELAAKQNNTKYTRRFCCPWE